MEGKIILVIKWKQSNAYAFPKPSEDPASQMAVVLTFC